MAHKFRLKMLFLVMQILSMEFESYKKFQIFWNTHSWFFSSGRCLLSVLFLIALNWWIKGLDFTWVEIMMNKYFYFYFTIFCSYYLYFALHLPFTFTFATTFLKTHSIPFYLAITFCFLSRSMYPCLSYHNVSRLGSVMSVVLLLWKLLSTIRLIFLSRWLNKN